MYLSGTDVELHRGNVTENHASSGKLPAQEEECIIGRITSSTPQ